MLFRSVLNEDVVWQFEYAVVTDGTDLDGLSYTAVVATADPATTTQNALIKTTVSETVANLTGWAAGALIYCRWSRKSTDANDTLDTRANTNDDALLRQVAVVLPQA